jgi:hypothetical protein
MFYSPARLPAAPFGVPSAAANQPVPDRGDSGFRPAGVPALGGKAGTPNQIRIAKGETERARRF